MLDSRGAGLMLRNAALPVGGAVAGAVMLLPGTPAAVVLRAAYVAVTRVGWVFLHWLTDPLTWFFPNRELSGRVQLIEQSVNLDGVADVALQHDGMVGLTFVKR